MFFRLAGVMFILFRMSFPSEASRREDPMPLIMRLVGAQTPEDVVEEDYERFSDFLAHPLPVNVVSKAKLVSSGLMTAYQAASFVDYREHHGDVLSVSELASLDGFSAETAEILAPFVSFDSDALPGNASFGRRRVGNEAVMRSGWKIDGKGHGYSYGFRYKLSAGYKFDMGLSFSRSYSDKVSWPQAQSFFFAYNGRGRLSRIVAGDYSLRYGQGLALWTGFSMSGVGTPASIIRRPYGITPYWSWSGSGSCRGVAADIRLGPLNVSASVAIGGIRKIMNGMKDVPVFLTPSLNVNWMRRNFQTSVTCLVTTADLRTIGQSGHDVFDNIKVAADFAWNIKGTDVFGEVAYDVINNAPAAVFGSRFRCGESLVLAAGGRYYPVMYDGKDSGAIRSGSRCSNEHGASLSGEFSAGRRVHLKGRDGFGSSVMRYSGSFSVDVAFFPENKAGMPPESLQTKMLLCGNIQVSQSVNVEIRLSERIRTWSNVKYRTDIRSDVKYNDGDWNGMCRINVVYGRKWSALSYFEGGYKDKVFSVYLRAGCFKADDWDDRIYVYERDAPGCFNVPACYGRGYWMSAVAGIKAVRQFKAYLRASWTDYPWMPQGKEKPGKAELKIQLVLDL